MSQWLVKNVDEFNDATSKALGTGKAVVIYFYGTWKEGTTDSWCGDCVDADVIIREQCKEQDAILIEIPVGTRDEYKGKPENQWRVFNKSQLTAIPTLFHWGMGGKKAILVERECVDVTAVSTLIANPASLNIQVDENEFEATFETVEEDEFEEVIKPNKVVISSATSEASNWTNYVIPVIGFAFIIAAFLKK